MHFARRQASLPTPPLKKKKKKHTAAILKEQHCGEKLELGMLEDLRYTARLFTVFDAFLFNTTSFLSVKVSLQSILCTRVEVVCQMRATRGPRSRIKRK